MNFLESAPNGIAFFERSSVSELSDWMLEGMDTAQWSPLDDRHNVSQFISALNGAGGRTRQKVLTALTESVSLWEHGPHGLEVIDTIATAVGMSRAKEAVPGLISVLDTISALSDSEQERETQSTILAVVAGFPKEKVAQSALRRWYTNDQLHWSLTGQLITGLAAGEPKRFAQYLPKLFATLSGHTNSFRLDYLTAELARLVTPNRLEIELRQFPNDETAATMLSFMPRVRQILGS